MRTRASWLAIASATVGGSYAANGGYGVGRIVVSNPAMDACQPPFSSRPDNPFRSVAITPKTREDVV